MAKNAHYERLIKRAKLYKKKINYRNWNHDLDIKVYHCYDQVEPKQYTWWDDVAFIHGNQLIVVWFVHPRLAYKDHVENYIYDELKANKDADPFTDNTPNYKYLGKNKRRKKIISYTLNSFSLKNRDFYDNWRNKTDEECKVSTFEQPCSIRIKQYEYCRGVDLIAPLEITTETDLVKCREIVLRHLEDPTYFQQTFGEYRYTSKNWVAEGH